MPVSDTVGCGDSLASAVVLGLIAGGADEGATLALGNAVGAATATGHGAGRQVAHVEMVRSLLRGREGDVERRALAMLEASVS